MFPIFNFQIEDLRRDIERLISIIKRKRILSSSLPFQSMDYVTQESKRTSDVRNAKKLIHGVNKRKFTLHFRRKFYFSYLNYSLCNFVALFTM